MTDYTDHFELAIYLTGDHDVWDEAIENKYGIPYELFCELIDDLLPLIEIADSPFTKQRYTGFANKTSQMWLAIAPVTDGEDEE